MFTLFAYFFLSLLAGGIFITGWFAVTRGRYVIQPDGERIWKGKIFSAWQKYWEQTKGEKKVFYYGHELKIFMLQIEQAFALTPASYRFNHDHPNPMCIIVNADVMQRLKDRFHVFQAGNPDTDILIKSGHNSNEFYIMFSKRIKQYVFSDKLRDPLASCIYCHSSLYGSLIWLTIFCIAKHYQAGICGHVAFILWPVYLISLSFVTPFLWKKL